jgi:hypothetical protein
MTRDEYEKAIASFLLELQGTMTALNNERLRDSLDLLSELEEFRIRMGDPQIENADLIGFCFGIVDEYLKTFWKENISDGFDLYRDLHLSKNKPA